jgi:polar amino acid transport system permease protein
MSYQWNFSSVWEHLPDLLHGVLVTVEIAVLSMLLGLILALLICFARLSPVRAISIAARVYTEFFRDTPLLVQIIWVYFSLPILTGIRFTATISALIAFSLNIAAYGAEVFRAGIVALERGQTDAAYGLGMTWWQSMRRVVLPQAVRAVLPPLGNMWVAAFKDTSLLATIAVTELMYQGEIIVVQTYRPLEVYTVVALLYFLVVYPQARLVDRLYARMRVRT